MVADRECLNPAFDKPRPDGSWQLTLTALELVDRLARFIPPPYRHLHRCIAIKVYSRRTPPRGRKWQRGQGRRSEKMDGGIIHSREKKYGGIGSLDSQRAGKTAAGCFRRYGSHFPACGESPAELGILPTSP